MASTEVRQTPGRRMEALAAYPHPKTAEPLLWRLRNKPGRPSSLIPLLPQTSETSTLDGRCLHTVE